MMYTHSSPEASDRDEGAEEFAALPRRLRQRIDRAFDETIRDRGDKLPPERNPMSRDAHQDTVDEEGGSLLQNGGGSFVTDEEGGGFMLDDLPSVAPKMESSASSTYTHIPLSLVPRALQRLDLPPDTDVLAIFENAASGWRGKEMGREEGVSRKDWRAVCAILFEDPTNTGMRSEQQSGSSDELGLGSDDDDDNDDDLYEENEEADGEEDAADSDYGPVANSIKHPLPKSRGRARQKPGKSSSSERSSSPKLYTLTLRQKKDARMAFALFFPQVQEKDLDKQRLKIKDVAAAAKLLKEKLTAEEIIEMMEFFSTAADKSLGLDDFGQMMMRTDQV